MAMHVPAYLLNEGCARDALHAGSCRTKLYNTCVAKASKSTVNAMNESDEIGAADCTGEEWVTNYHP